MRILVTGASGMLGATLVKILASNFTVYATGNSNYKECSVPYMQFDLASDFDCFRKLISWSKPELIIHSGAITNGNYCDNNPLEAFNVNGVSVRKFIETTEENVRIIYISTDAVFPSRIHLAKETDLVSPESIYGKSKELGEFFLSNSDRKYTIIRTTIVGLNENKAKIGFVEWVINSSLKKETIGLFNDVIFTPISIWSLTAELEFIINNNLISSETLHIAGSEYYTKYEFGVKLLEALNMSISKVEESKLKRFPDRAKRCFDQSIDVNYYQQKYKRNLPSLEKTIESIKQYYNE